MDGMIENPIPWPDGARCAVAITFDMDADSSLNVYQAERADTLIAAQSFVRYGPSVAIPRIARLFKRFDLRQTFFLPGWCIEKYPKAVALLRDEGHELALHGYLHERPNELSKDDELYWLRRGLDAFVDFTGERPRGWRAPSFAFSKYSLGFLLDEGFDYDSSLMGDDIPYLLDNGSGTVVELPSHYALDDWPHFMTSRDFGYMISMKSPATAIELYRAEFDAMWEYGGLWIGVWHPFLSGRLARWVEIVRLIEYMHEKGGVWFATLEDIAAHVRGVVADGSWQPRTDRLPYYDKPIPELGEAEPTLASL